MIFFIHVEYSIIQVLNMVKKSKLTQFKNFLLVVAGTLVLAFATAVFILPYDLLIGGVSSIAIIIVNGFNIEAISIDIVIGIVTWGLFFLGLLFLGKDFALKTLVSTVVYPLGISLFSYLVDPNVLNGLFCLSDSEYSEIAILLSAVIGGILTGAGCAITFLGNGSTGGVDILAFIICKLFKKAKSSYVIFAIDAIAVICGIFVIQNLVLSLLGLVAVFLSAVAIDKIFVGESTAFIAQVVSSKYDEINSLVLTQLERTTSIAEITGGYSGEKKKMLIISFSKSQYSDLMEIIKQCDKTAFVNIFRAHQINGEGWTW